MDKQVVQQSDKLFPYGQVDCCKTHAIIYIRIYGHYSSLPVHVSCWSRLINELPSRLCYKEDTHPAVREMRRFHQVKKNTTTKKTLSVQGRAEVGLMRGRPGVRRCVTAKSSANEPLVVYLWLYESITLRAPCVRVWGGEAEPEVVLGLSLNIRVQMYVQSE